VERHERESFITGVGNDAVDGIAAHHRLLHDDLHRWAKLSRSTDR
jgi:hypothetical protein